MRWVALLRGVNVGTAARVAMADLRAGVEGLGATGVRTHLNSGNVVFDSDGEEPALRDALEGVVAALLGRPGQVLVRSGPELARVVAACPYPDPDPKQVQVAFLSGPLPLDLPASPNERVAGERCLYLRFAGPSHDSPLAKALVDRRLPVVVTVRNWRTTTALAQLARNTPERP